MFSTKWTLKPTILTHGFTLVELLVVIAIISMLSSVILASLNNARARAQTTAIQTQVLEFRKLMQLEFLEQGSYANLNKSWAGTTVSCETRGYTGAHATKAVAICNAIRANISNQSANEFYTGVNTVTGFSTSNHFSVMARLPSGFYFCAGSGGGTSDRGTGTGGWVASGCHGNP